MKSYDLAFRLFEKIEFINEMDNCYTLMENNEKNLEQKYEIMTSHALFS